LFPLLWILSGAALMGYGWFANDLRYMVLGAVLILDTNIRLLFERLRRDLRIQQ
jgi:hypothetical protein